MYQPSPPSLSSGTKHYRKAPQLPIYYALEPACNVIESIKDWPGGQVIDRYAYSEPFAADIRNYFSPISAERYRWVRERVSQASLQPIAQIDGSPQPKRGWVEE